MPLGLLPTIGPTELMIVMMTGILLAWPAWRICNKAGFPGPLGLLAVVPGFNLVLLIMLAFADWPALRPRTAADKAAGNDVLS